MSQLPIHPLYTSLFPTSFRKKASFPYRYLLPCILSLLLWTTPRTASAQCPMENTAFNPGEDIRYELYFNWKFIWKKVGTARFTTRSVRYGNQPAYRIDLVTGTAGFVDKFFRMRDTISTITSLRLEPLFYRKAAAEGKNYYIDQAHFSYADGQTQVKLHQLKNHTKNYHGKYKGEACVYDMLSIMARARSWNPAGFKKGQRIRFLMADAENVEKELLLYRGKEVVESKDGHHYRCLVFSFYEDNDEDRDRELIRFFITDDANHLPIRLDMNLNFGSAKAFMKSVKGNRHPLTSRVK